MNIPRICARSLCRAGRKWIRDDAMSGSNGVKGRILEEAEKEEDEDEGDIVKL